MSLFEAIKDTANSAYTGLDTLVGGILPLGKDINEGWVANLGRDIASGLGLNSIGNNRGIASVQDTQSLKPTLDYEAPSQEGAFNDFFSSPDTTIDKGSMGLFDAFEGDVGPRGVEGPAGYLEPKNYMEIRTGSMSGWQGADSDFGTTTSITDLGNGSYEILHGDTSGFKEKFIQQGVDGTGGISSYENNSTSAEGMASGGIGARTSGIDISSYFALAKVDPDTTLQVGEVVNGTPRQMERIDDLNDSTFIKLAPLNLMGGGGGSTKASESFAQDVLNNMFLYDQAMAGSPIESNPVVQQLREGKTLNEALGTDIQFNTDPVVNAGDLNSTLPSVTDNNVTPQSNSSLADAFADGGLADGGDNQTGLYSTPTQRYLEDENVFDTKADDFMSERNRNPQYKEIFGKPADEAIADMVSLGISKETATKIINKRDASTGNKQPMQFTNPSTATNNINPGNPTPQENSNDGLAPNVTKNVATGLTTVTNADGSQSELVYDQTLLNSANAETTANVETTVPTQAQLDTALTLASEEAFREFDQTLRVNTSAPDSAGSNQTGFDVDLFEKSRADFLDVFEKSGATMEQIKQLEGEVDKIGLMDKAKNILPELNANDFLGTVKGFLNIPKNFKIFDNSRKQHNIRQSQIRKANELNEKLAKDAGRKWDNTKDILNMELNLPGLIAELENTKSEIERSGIDADLSSTEDLLNEMRLAHLQGKDVAVLEDEKYEERESLDKTINNLGDTSELSDGDYVKVFTHSGEEVVNDNIYENATTRGTESWGVKNKYDESVANWNPFAPESSQERDMRNEINPQRGYGDGTGLDPEKYPEQANMGYSSPTMATIDRNIRPALDYFGDFIEYPFELAGLGLQNTIGRIPGFDGRISDIGQRAGNSLAKMGQKFDRAIDTNLPDSMFGLKTGGGGGDEGGIPHRTTVNEDGSVNIGVDKIREWTETYGPGDSPLVEYMRDKYLYGMHGGQDGSAGPGGYNPMFNSVSSPGGGNMPVIQRSFGNNPGGSGSLSANTGLGMGDGSGLSNVADGFDLSTAEGQNKFADMYGEDALDRALKSRGIMDKRGGLATGEAAPMGKAFVGSEEEGLYDLKDRRQKPQPNIGSEIGKGITEAIQGKEEKVSV